MAKDTKFNYEKYYKNYWSDEFKSRDNNKYYQTLYHLIKKKIIVDDNKLNIIDVGGGNGQFLSYMGYKNGTVLDISDSGLIFAEKLGYKTIKTNVLSRYPIKEETYDVAYCFEVLEHLDKPNKTLCEINNILKTNGILYISIPNFKPDGIHHKKRWKYLELKNDLKKCGYEIIWFVKKPRFDLNYREVMKTENNFIMKLILILGNFIFFKSLRNLLTEIFPNAFVAMYIVKCKKVI